MELGFYQQYLRTRSMAWRRAKEKDVLKKKKKKQHATCSFKELSNFFFMYVQV